jgi:hypothetical protein
MTEARDFDPAQFAAAVKGLHEMLAPLGWEVRAGHRGSVLMSRARRLVRLVDQDSAEAFAANELLASGGIGAGSGSWTRWAARMKVRSSLNRLADTGRGQ